MNRLNKQRISRTFLGCLATNEGFFYLWEVTWYAVCLFYISGYQNCRNRFHLRVLLLFESGSYHIKPIAFSVTERFRCHSLASGWFRCFEFCRGCVIRLFVSIECTAIATINRNSLRRITAWVEPIALTTIRVLRGFRYTKKRVYLQKKIWYNGRNREWFVWIHRAFL